MKVSIIGGGGRVGSNAAYALQCGAVVSEIALIDANVELAEGEALDLAHGTSIAADQTIRAGGPAVVSESDIVCITAGSRRKPDESRLDLINRNVSIFNSILDDLRSHNLRKEAIIFVVSNPVDILTRLAIERLDWPEQRVLGLGTVLDTTRFRSMIAQAKSLPPTQVKALILGEHGDSMTPIWSSATAAGIALAGIMNVNEQKQIFDRTKGSGAEVIRRKGGAGYAVGLGIAQVIHSIALDKKQILPVSTRMTGQYNIRNVCLSIPAIIGREGVLGHIETELWPKETAGLHGSAKALDEVWQQLV